MSRDIDMPLTLEGLEGLVHATVSRFKGSSRVIETVELLKAERPGDAWTWRFRLYTRTNSYAIVAVTRNGQGKPPYLGCVSSSRTPRAGEAHTRGRDLHDGPCTEATWNRILADILSFELVELAQQDEPVPLPQSAQGSSAAESGDPGVAAGPAQAG